VEFDAAHDPASFDRGKGLIIRQPANLPWTLEPGQEHDLAVTFSPLEDMAYEGVLWVTTNEPLGQDTFDLPSDEVEGHRTADLTGEGSSMGRFEENFRQGDGPWEKTDLLIAVDRSCSMSDGTRNLGKNFTTFAQILSDAEVDWQAGVVTEDGGCINGDPLTADTPDLTRAMMTVITGGYGSDTERLLTVTRDALENADGCNAGLLREDSKTLVLMVSDEPEQSSEPWDSLVDEILSAAPTAILNSVAGPVPNGCGSATAGQGYFEASEFTGGLFMSICDLDWAGHLTLLADLVMDEARDTFELTQLPAPDSIRVVINETEVTTGWTYDFSINSVVFEQWSLPEPGLFFTVDYLPSGACE
jgi:hypothetical protein